MKASNFINKNGLVDVEKYSAYMAGLRKRLLWRFIAELIFGASVFIVLVFFFIASAPSCAQEVPQSAAAYKRTLIRSAHGHWGLDAPVSLFAAQIHQESGWRIDARSPAGAEGLAQFMPATSEWFSTLHPRDLTTAQPYNPAWAMRALVLYNQYLYRRVDARDICQRWAFTLSAYNGGLGWVNRDKALAQASGVDPLIWFDATEDYNAGRGNAAFAENRHYPKAIIYRHQPLYVAAGWGTSVCGVGGNSAHF